MSKTTKSATASAREIKASDVRKKGRKKGGINQVFDNNNVDVVRKV